MLSTLNFFICVIAGLLSVYVLWTHRINTMHPLAMLFVAFSGLGFTVCLISGMVEPELLTRWNIAARIMALMAFACWVLGRIQCHNGICQLKEENWRTIKWR